MIVAEVVLGARHWLPWAGGLVLVALGVLAWSYFRTGSVAWVRITSALLKAAAFALLAACLLDPLMVGERARPGSNLFVVLADNSASLQLADRTSTQTRGMAMKARMADSSAWLTRLGQDFDVRRYVFDTSLRPVTDLPAALTLDGPASALATSVASVAQRFQGQPLAGILLLTDGNATDDFASDFDWRNLPPVYPVALGEKSGLVDLAVGRLTHRQTNFEAAPVAITAEIQGQGVADKKILVRVLDESGQEVERRAIQGPADGVAMAQRFLLRPERPGVSFYTVETCLDGEENLTEDAGHSAEATRANNRRIATIDRGGGPYRILYVSGRPNWEFKFLRRALAEDDELHLVGLIRVAKKEPKFTFLGQSGERTNPLFRGFGNQGDEQAEQYDQPVLLTIDPEHPEDLRGGFPKSRGELFAYHAVILDDIEASFFNQDQLSLLQQFVSQRGGGFMMLAGKDSFAEGGYQRTPVADLLPVYLDRVAPIPDAGGYRFQLTREGQLQPWVRVRTTEAEEAQRLAAMPDFKTVNRVDAIKPGAAVLAQVTAADGATHPALVVQPFGHGRTAALLVGDLWRWNLHRKDATESDLEKSWRQTARWLVSDVPQRVEVETQRTSGSVLPGVRVVVRARSAEFEPLDNAQVALRVHTPDERDIDLVADSSDQAAGQYEATFVPRVPGIYRAQVTVTDADGSTVGQREAGWTVEPETEEFRTLSVNRALLDRIAGQTGGEVLTLGQLDRFAAGLDQRKAPIVESWTYPLWHQWRVLLLAMGLLVGEWGLRRWKGLP